MTTPRMEPEAPHPSPAAVGDAGDPRGLVLAHLAGRPVDRLPAMPITMMFAARLAGIAYRDYCLDHRLLARAQHLVAERFGFDHVSCISDPTREAGDLGARVAWFPDQPPALDDTDALLADPARLASLRQADPLGGGRMTDRVEAVELLRAGGASRLVEGWVEGPCAEAADLRGISTLMLDFFDRPGFVNDLFGFATRLAAAFARAQVDAGVDIVGIGDAAASLVGPDIYEEVVWPHEKRLIDEIHGMGALVRLHICGNTRRSVTAMARLGADIVDLDSLVPLEAAQGGRRPGPGPAGEPEPGDRDDVVHAGRGDAAAGGVPPPGGQPVHRGRGLRDPGGDAPREPRCAGGLRARDASVTGDRPAGSGVRSAGSGVRRLPAVAEITGHADVKAAAKDWTRFSSALQGDPDVRTYPQLPLEVDPPEHTELRAILTPIFARQAVAALEPRLRAVAADLVAGLARRGSAEAVHELALPMVAASIGLAYGRPQDVDELRSWGVETWQTLPDGSRDGSHLEAYLARVFDEAARQPGDDAFSRIAGARFDGRPLTRLEMLGLGNLILAGGRDTVIALISGAIWHLAEAAPERRRLARDPARIPAAIEELLRFLSPLPRMERKATGDVAAPWGQAAAGEIVLLGFARANHDPAVFEDPETIRLERGPNPHVAFGNGPHTCIGVHLARLEARVLLEELLAAVPDWRVGADARITFERVGDARVPVRFDALPIEVGA